jgi:hypothetical protein
VQKKNRRIRVIMASMLFMVLFSVYFVGTYLMSNKTYSLIPHIVDDLSIIYFRDSCVRNLMIFTKENIIQNKSYVMFKDH